MRKILVGFNILLILLFIQPLQVNAQGPDVGENDAVISFGELGFIEDELFSPFDSTNVRFTVPANWRLTSGGEIVLEFDLLISGSDIGKLSAEGEFYSGTLAVTFNRQIIGTIYLSELGSHTVHLPIPDDALLSQDENNKYNVEILLNASISCDYDIHSSVILKPTSYLYLPFEISKPVMDLSRLPYPYYSRNSLVPLSQTMLVVPDNPDIYELQAALNVAVGFGSMTGGSSDLNLITASQLSDDLLVNANLIFIGTPEKFNQLSDVQFTSPVENGKFVNLDPVFANDGIIQITNSPWNENNAVMLVSGNTGEATNMAGRAVSTGNIFLMDDPTIAFVAEIQDNLDSSAVVENMTFEDLGYGTETISGVGFERVEYLFYVAKEQVNSQDGYIDLNYSHIGVLENIGSSVVVALNGEVISSGVLLNETEILSLERIEIPTGLLRFGENQLDVMVTLLPHVSCDFVGHLQNYLSIDNQSLIHIPVGPPDESNGTQFIDLQLYPKMFLGYSDLGNLAFVLPKEHSPSWNIAANIAFLLGDVSVPSISNLKVVYGDEASGDVLQNNGLIIVGKPSMLPLLNEINDVLPAPFDFSSDTASEKELQVVYRIPPGVSLGYLEILSSPYNGSEAVLIVAGNSDQGVDLAGSALTNSDLKNQISGLFAVTNGTQVVSSRVSPVSGSGSRQTSIVGDIVSGADEVVVAQVPDVAVSTTQISRPAWLLPVFIGSAVVLGLIILYLIGAAVSKKRIS